MWILFWIVFWIALILVFAFHEDPPSNQRIKTVYEDYEIINGIVVYKKGIDYMV